MKISEIVLDFIEFRDIQALSDKVLKVDLDIFLKQSRLRIIFSLLLKEDILIDDDNDEIVLELIIEKETFNGTADITDSQGNYYLKDLNVNINDEYIEYLKRMVYKSIDNIVHY